MVKLWTAGKEVSCYRKGTGVQNEQIANKSYSTALTKIRIAQNRTVFGDSGKTQGLVALSYTKEMLPGVYTNN